MNFLVRNSAIVAAILLACATVPPAHATTKDASTSQKQKAAVGQSAAARQIKQLAADYYLANARFEPVGQTYAGNNRFDDQLGLS
jgi:hypothetical protein